MAKWIADILLIAVAGFVGSVICAGVERKQLARMTVVVAVMMCLLLTIEDISPVIQGWSDKINSVQKIIQKIP